MRRSSVRDPRSWGLLFCAGACASRAAAYIPGTHEKLPIGLREASFLLPVWVYGVLWAVSAVIAVAVAVAQWPPKGWHSLMVVPPLLWAGFYATSQMFDRVPAGATPAITSALLFACLAGIMACLILIPPRRV